MTTQKPDDQPPTPDFSLEDLEVVPRWPIKKIPKPYPENAPQPEIKDADYSR